MSSAMAREVRLNVSKITKTPDPVYLPLAPDKITVYDLHQSNSWLQHIGLGMYHSGIEVLGMEYTFSEAGIGQHAPRRISGDACVYKTTEVLGDFVGTIQDVRVILNRLRQGGFAEGAYEVVRKNCNHFCDEFCFALLERRIPSWVNRAASLGSWAGLRGSTAPEGTPGRPNAAGTSARGSRNAGSVSMVTASAAAAREPKQLTKKQRDLLARMRANKSSSGE